MKEELIKGKDYVMNQYYLKGPKYIHIDLTKEVEFRKKGTEGNGMYLVLKEYFLEITYEEYLEIENSRKDVEIFDLRHKV